MEIAQMLEGHGMRWLTGVLRSLDGVFRLVALPQKGLAANFHTHGPCTASPVYDLIFFLPAFLYKFYLFLPPDSLCPSPTILQKEEEEQ